MASVFKLVHQRLVIHVSLDIAFVHDGRGGAERAAGVREALGHYYLFQFRGDLLFGDIS